MPCTKCRSDFNLFNWKIKCGECGDKYCSKCLSKRDGVLYCEKCIILMKRPPDPFKLMELKSKDLQDYLNKHNISTYGLVEKQELVDLFCNRHIPQKPKRGVEKLTANFAGSLPNIRPHLNDFLENLETVIASETNRNGSATVTRQPPPPPPPQPPESQFRPSAPPAEPQATTSASSPTSQESPNVNMAQQNVNLSSHNNNNSESNKVDEAAATPPLTPKYPKLSDFNTADDLTNLSSKQLKQLLTLNRVDFKGCVEKSELLERAKRLWNDNQQLTKEMPESVLDLCKLCMDAPLDCVLLECGHIATCINCGKKLAECPICRQYVTRVVRTFKA